MKKFFAALVIATTMALGCVGCPNISPQPVPIPAVINDTDKCGPACKHIGPSELNCEEGMPGKFADGGTYTCEEYCVNAQSNEHINVWLNPSCVVNVKTCNEIESCAISGEPK